MSKDVIEYSYSKANKRTIIFVPGYTGGLEVSTIQKLKDFFVGQGGNNVYGLAFDYKSDVMDLFTNSQNKLIDEVRKISAHTQGTEVILMAKSLGGSLVVYNHNRMLVHKIIVLGCSVVLGWPQRISLLQATHAKLPDYRKEWSEALKTIHIPTTILSSDSDELTDNEYLGQAAKSNEHLRLVVIPHTDHNLEDVTTGQLKLKEILDAIE